MTVGGQTTISQPLPQLCTGQGVGLRVGAGVGIGEGPGVGARVDGSGDGPAVGELVGVDVGIGAGSGVGLQLTQIHESKEMLLLSIPGRLSDRAMVTTLCPEESKAAQPAESDMLIETATKVCGSWTVGMSVGAGVGVLVGAGIGGVECSKTPPPP